MAYGIVKVDNITFDNGGSDQNVTVSGLYRATTSGVTVSGTIAAGTVSGVTVIGSTTVSGATVTGTTANFTSGNFSNIISSAATMSGALIMASQQQVRFRELDNTNHIALQAPEIVSADQTITLPDQTGTVVTTGDNGSVTSTMILDGTILNANISASAAIADTKLATISTAGKVSGTAITSGTIATSSEIGITNTGPIVRLTESDGTATHSQTVIVRADNKFLIQTRSSTGVFLSTDYAISADASGANDHSWRIANAEKARLNSAGLTVVNDLTISDKIIHTGDTNTAIRFPAADTVTVETAGSERLRITSAGLVGIGTSSPATKLQVNDSTVYPALLKSTGVSSTLVLANSGTSNDFHQGIGAFGTDVSLVAGNARCVTVTSAGNVGIGTTSPAGQLQVALASSFAPGGAWDNKTVAFGGTGSFSGAVGIAYDDTNGGYISSIVPGSAWKPLTLRGSYLSLATDAGGERLRIDASGRVGIGTTSPTTTLDVNGDVTITDKIIHAGDTNTAIRFPAADTVSIETGGSERVRVDSVGRILAGTTSYIDNWNSNQKLIIAGTGVEGIGIATGNSQGVLAFGRSGNATPGSSALVTSGDNIGIINFSAGDGSALIGAARITAVVDGAASAGVVPGRLVFATSATTGVTEAMRVNSGRELLIGYTADNGAYKLQVNSQIFATSATIATSDGRYKENVATLNGCIDLVNALRPVSFDWKPQQDITRIDEDGNSVLVREGHNFPDGKQVGFIAQEVQEVLADKPWLGSVIKQNVRPAIEDADGNELAPEEEFFGIAEGNLTAVLTAALQEAIAKINGLEARIAALEA